MGNRSEAPASQLSVSSRLLSSSMVRIPARPAIVVSVAAVVCFTLARVAHAADTTTGGSNSKSSSSSLHLAQASYTFDTVNQSLSQALKNYAQITHQQIIYTEDLVAGRNASALKGQFSAETALRKLLTGTGLAAERSPSGAWMIKTNPASSGSNVTNVGSGSGSLLHLAQADHPQSNDAVAASDSPRSEESDDCRNNRRAAACRPAPDGLEEIVVTANKRTESLSTVTSSVAVASGDFLSKIGAKSLNDYIGYLPNVYFAPAGATGQGRVVIRGIGGDSQGATTGTYIDDVPFGSSTVFAGGAFLTPDLDASDLSRVEVLRGPQGTLYGASAPGGLLKYVTKAPDPSAFSAHAKEDGVAVDHGSVGNETRVGVNVPIVDGKVAFRASAFLRVSPGFVDNPTFAENNVNSNHAKGANGSVLLNLTPDWSVRISGLYQKLHANGFNQIPVDSDTNQPIIGRYITDHRVPQWADTTNTLASGVVTYNLGFATVTSATGLSWIKSGSRDDLSPDGADYGYPAPNYFISDSQIHTNKVSEELRLASPSGEKIEWLVGGFYTRESSTSNPQYKVLSPDFQVDTTQIQPYYSLSRTRYAEWAEFFNLTYYITPQLDVTGGFRYATNTQVYDRKASGPLIDPDNPSTFVVYPTGQARDSSPTYLASTRWKLDSESMVYARYATSYRPGGPRVLSPGATPPPGFTDSFRPEYLKSYEAGVRLGLLDRHLTVDVSLFDIEWHDLLGGIRIGHFGVYGNAGDASSRGLEASVRFRPISELIFDAGFGYTHARLTKADPTFGPVSGDELPYTPAYSASFNGEYTKTLKEDLSLFVGAGLHYRSQVRGDFASNGNVVFDPLTLVDAHAGLNWRQYTFSLYVQNLFDVYKFDGEYAGTEQEYYSITPPRTVGLNIARSF